jgi:hypothetical protein
MATPFSARWWGPTAVQRWLCRAILVEVAALGLVGLVACRNNVGGPQGEGEGEAPLGEGEGDAGEGEGECVGPPVVGMRVLATDAATSALVCDASVITSDGSNDFALAPATFNGQCVYEGLHDQPGTYTVLVQKPGYIDVEQGNLVVQSNGCHVTTNVVTLTLNRG